MSFDLQVWSAKTVPSDFFADRTEWTREAAAWVHRQKNWQIVVATEAHVEPEDVPEDAAKLLPGIEWLTYLHLEGKAASSSCRLIYSVAEDLARATHGAVHDPQENSIWLPSGVKRLIAKRSQEPFEVISLSWWFLESPIEERRGRERLLSIFERDIPECLPKRYGKFEPPQHVYEKTGKEHFLNFLDENLCQPRHRTIVWYPHRPVVALYLSIPNPRGSHKLGFRTGYLRIDLERQVLAEPGWAGGLIRFWRNISKLIRPIYGDVRALGGYRWMGATVGITAGTQAHRVRSWWWAGIPERLGLAVVLGEVYQQVWPKFVSAAQLDDGLAFLAMNDWSLSHDLTEIVGTAPEGQLMRPEKTVGTIFIRGLGSKGGQSGSFLSKDSRTL